jgi:hypothetical protein
MGYFRESAIAVVVIVFLLLTFLFVISVAAVNDGWQAATWQMAILGGSFTVILGIVQWQQATEQRKVEWRWRKAEMAKKLIDEMFADKLARDALSLIDGNPITVTRKRNEKTHEQVLFFTCVTDSYEERKLTLADARLALTNPQQAPDERDWINRPIWEMFDSMFYWFDRIEHYIQRDLIDFEDVKSPADYYARKLKDLPCRQYINATGSAKRAAEFLDRFRT